MMLQPGHIIKNLSPSEPVRIIEIKPLGDMYSVSYVGLHSKIAGEKVIASEQLTSLQIISEAGKFSFNGNPEEFKLYAEAERIRSAYLYDPLFAVNCSIVDPLPHQIEAVYRYMLPLPRIRFLLADDTGAGKTIMTGLLVKELMLRDLIRRVLIITPGGLTKQWQEDELGLKFNMHFKLVDRAAFSSDPNIFSSTDKLITSIDFLRADDVLNVVGETGWDMIVVDEAHKLSVFEYGRRRYVSKRYRVLETLSQKCDHILLLTATPHRGRRDTFRNLLQLLDADIFSTDVMVNARINDYGQTGVNRFFIRRLKEAMHDWNGQPLFVERYTRTVQYDLTPEEKRLYDEVTAYLLNKREEAQRNANIYVSLALMVMQRRLTSSIYAIYKTLKNRYLALNELLDAVTRNPKLLTEKIRLELELESMEDFDELDDQAKESLADIMADPRKARLFTTATSPGDIREEAIQVKKLYQLAENLYQQEQEEQKLRELNRLLVSEKAIEGEKLVIFTEHKDTLEYLKKKLTNTGYTVVTIHGNMSVDERRKAQKEFAGDKQILIATDAAGEGINLQFCRLLINWDIPWNPNRLEQRMGRIHRYGQERDVLVFNLVARNTREGKVLSKLLQKLDVIREQIGSDRVYDVISDVFEGVSLEDIIASTLDGRFTDYDRKMDESLTEENIREKIQLQRESLGHTEVDYRDARELKERSDERRLQPIYIRNFFEQAFLRLGGAFTEIHPSVFRIDKMPDILFRHMKQAYHLIVEPEKTLFCFDKQIFLEFQDYPEAEKLWYVNPGNPFFDSLLEVVIREYRESMVKGTILVSANDSEPFHAFIVRSRIQDNRHGNVGGNIADESIRLVLSRGESEFMDTSPGKLIDLISPATFTKEIQPEGVVSDEAVVDWSFINITKPQLKQCKKRVEKEITLRKEYLEDAFNQVIADLVNEVNQLQGKLLLGDQRVEEKIQKFSAKIEDLKTRRAHRIKLLEQMAELTMLSPEVLGCAWVVPLKQLEFEDRKVMARDEEVERTAMETAMQFERDKGRYPEDVSAENLGYDIRSTDNSGMKRYIEVKGRATAGPVMLSENEMNRLGQLDFNAWLYIVFNCKSKPELKVIHNPAKNLAFEILFKGVQYLIPQKQWSDYQLE